MNDAQWDYIFDGASGFWGKQPALATAGQFPFMAGIDGRYDGVLRRYPGHIRYDADTARAVETAREAFPFVIQAAPGSNTLCRGYLACDTGDGHVEAVWRKDDDTADTLRTTDIKSPNAILEVFDDVSDVAASDAPGGPFDAPKNSTVRIHKLFEFNWDGETSVVAIGDFEMVGSKHASGVAVYRGGAWQPLGFPGFDGPIYTAAIFNDELYIGGAFTMYTDGICKRLAKWTGETWVQVSTGVNNTVWTLKEFSGALWAGGAFTEDGAGNSSLRVISTNGTTLTAKTSTAGFNDGIVYALEVLNSVLYAGGTFTADGGTNAIAQPMAYLNGGTDWDYVGTTGTSPTYTEVKSLVALPADTRLYVGWRNGTTAAGVSDLTTARSWAAQLTNASSTSANTEIVLSSGATNVYASILDGSFTTYGALAYVASAGGTWTAIGNSTAAGYTLERTDGSLWVGGRASIPLSLAREVGDAGGTFDVCYAGPFLYLYSSNGNHRVISYDADTDDLISETLGPGKIYLSEGTLAAQTSSSNNAQAGNYAAAYRYIDRRRNRLTALSDQARIVATDGDALRLTPPTGAYDEAPTGYDRMQLFSSLSSGAATTGAGGTLYRVGEGSISTSTSKFVQSDYHENTAAAKDDGAGNHNFETTDGSLVQDPTRIYDFVREEVFDVAGVAACAIYQGSTFVLERRGGFLDLRWSPTSRYEPENFPTANTFPTRIPDTLIHTCKFLEVGDFLYCFGGTRMYRIQKSGTAVGIIELHSDFPFLHKNGCVKVGTRAYVTHEAGVLLLDGKSGEAIDLPSLQRVFYDRWRGRLSPNTTGTATNIICCAYDSRMRCVYLHHRSLQETICLWLSTGKVSMLRNHRAFNCVTMPELDSKISMRAYFMDDTSTWINTPNWDKDSDEPETMTGYRIYSQGAKYNQIVNQSLNLGVRLEFASNLFTTDGSTTRLTGDITIGVLTGTDVDRVYNATRNDTDELLLQGVTESNIADGDAIAIDPIVMEVIGANLWEPSRGSIRLRHRKRIQRMSITPQRISSPGPVSTSSVTPVSTYGQIKVGTLRNEELIANEPLSGSPTKWVATRQSEPVREGLALSTKIKDNWVEILDEGTLLYPYLLCLCSNFTFELLLWTIDGGIYDSDVEGD